MKRYSPHNPPNIAKVFHIPNITDPVIRQAKNAGKVVLVSSPADIPLAKEVAQMGVKGYKVYVGVVADGLNMDGVASKIQRYAHCRQVTPA